MNFLLSHLSGLYRLMINNRWKQTIYYNFWNRVQSTYFCIKLISSVQNVHHRPRRMRSDVCESPIALLIVVRGKSSQICCSVLFSPKWSSSLSEVCEMAEALHPTHDSQVSWGLVNLVAIPPLRLSRYGTVGRPSDSLHLTGRVSCLCLIWHNCVKFRDSWIKFCNLP